MIYSSTRGSDINLKFGDVLLNGLAKDGGLYVPNSVKSYSKKELDSLRELDYSSLAFELTKDFVQGEISLSEYKKICINSYKDCLLYTSPSPRDDELSRMPSSA